MYYLPDLRRRARFVDKCREIEMVIFVDDAEECDEYCIGYGGWCRLWRMVSVMADGVCYGGSFCRLAGWN